MDRVLWIFAVAGLLFVAFDALVLGVVPQDGLVFAQVVGQSMLAYTAFCLCFAAAIVALILAGQRRERGWLIALVALTVVLVYGRYLFAFAGNLESAIAGGDAASGAGYVWTQVIIDVLVPLPVVLAALLYARAHRAVPADPGLQI